MELLGQSRREGDLGGWWGGARGIVQAGRGGPTREETLFQQSLDKEVGLF